MGDDLEKRVASAQAKLEERSRPSSNAAAGKGMGLGFRMGTDFVAAIIVGAVLGWGIDALFGVSPWGLVICLVLGFITGVRNVVRQAAAVQKDAETEAAPAEPGPDTVDKERGA